MNFFKHFDLKFAAPAIEDEFQATKKLNMMKDFQVTMIVIMLVTLTGGLNGIIKGSGEQMAYGFVTVGVVFIVYCFRKLCANYVDYLTLVVIFFYNLYRIFYMREFYTRTTKASFFFQGYTYGILQMILISRCPRMIHKLLVIIATYALRFSLFPTIVSPDPIDVWTYLRSFIIDAFILYYFYSTEKTERKVFQGFTDKREELMKFKELVDDSLPQSVTIISCRTIRPLFSNKTFLSMFENYEITENSPQNPSFPSLASDTQKPHTNFLIVDHTTIREMGTDQSELSPISFTSDSIYFHEVLEKLISQNILREKALSLTASWSSFERRKLYEIVLKKIKWEGVNAVAVIFNDITYQENIIALKVASINKDKIIATISHELKTPLHGIIGLLEITEQEDEKGEKSKYLSLCKDNAYLLLGLVNSILDLQQLSIGKFKLNPTRIDIRKTLTDILGLFKYQSQTKELSLELVVSKEVPSHITTDEKRLKEILIHLIGNAIKFTSSGIVRLEAIQNLEEKESLEIAVIDTGLGIEEEIQENLFRMTGRLEDVQGVNKNGVGLGLTVSNALALILNGKTKGRAIELTSKYGEGTRFYFKILKHLKDNFLESQGGKRKSEKSERKKNLAKEGEKNSLKEANIDDISGEYQDNSLPIDVKIKLSSQAFINNNIRMQSLSLQPNSSRSLMMDTLLTKENSQYTRKKPEERRSFVLGFQSLNNGFGSAFKDNQNPCILVVDDNSFNLLIAQNLLKSFGYLVKTAQGGHEAIDKVKASHEKGETIKAILMDCQMPLMDGYEATKILKEMMSNNEIKQIPILAWTANDSIEDIKRCYESGMSGYLSKPTSQEALLKALTRLQ